MRKRRPSVGKVQSSLVLVAGGVIAVVVGVLTSCRVGLLTPFACFWALAVANTVFLFLGSAMLGLGIGFFVGWARSSGRLLVSVPAGIYVETLRGIPRIVIVLLAIFIFPRIGNLSPLLGWLGDVDSAVLWGILALGVSSGAYQAEVFRSGFQSIPHGQIEAAHSIGMRHGQTMRHVTLPQVIRTVLPPLGNEWIIVLKDTSLLVALTGIPNQFPGVFEVTARAIFLRQAIFDPTVWPFIFLAAAAIYLVLTVAISRTIQFVEERFRVPGLGVLAT